MRLRRFVSCGIVLSFLSPAWAQDIERQPLHLCAPPRDPIENEQLLATYDMTVKEEYLRYFDELNAYMICLQKSLGDIVQQANTWNERYRERFGDS